MDVLKTGIGLRGYNQKEPLTEYKQESYKLFEALVRRIKFESLKLLYTVEFKFEDVEDELEKFRDELALDEEQLISNEYQDVESGEGISIDDLPHFKATKKPRRNEPCPCGSGKKYKHCCAKSGSKRGPLA
jgi:preprotein translocase subunit SecA